VASVWVKPVSGGVSDVKLYYEVNGALQPLTVSSSNATITAGGWKLINLPIPALPAGSTLTVGCRNDHASVEAYIDDMRFRPANAVTTAYVYDAFSGELTHILDNNNLFVRFEYDAAGRLVKTYKEKNGIGEFKTGQFEYNFGSYATYTNDPLSQNFTRDNCPSGQWGTTQAINIPAGTITSLVSKDDANDMAKRFAQAQVNSSGSCFVPTVTLQLVSNISYASNFRAEVNSQNYAFPATGTLSYTGSPGTYAIRIWPVGGNQTNYVFTYRNGPDQQTITGTYADFGNKTISLNSTVELSISTNP
jgi:hypothetical protein